MNSPRMLKLKIWKILGWVQIYNSKFRSDVTAVFLCCHIFSRRKSRRASSVVVMKHTKKRLVPVQWSSWFISSSHSVATTCQQVVEYGGKMQLIFYLAPIHTFWTAWTRTRRPLPNVKLISQLRRLIFSHATSHFVISWPERLNFLMSLCFTFFARAGCKSSKLKLQHVWHMVAIMVQGTVDFSKFTLFMSTIMPSASPLCYRCSVSIDLVLEQHINNV